MKLGMGSDGVALGTVIAQYSGLFMALYFFRKYFRQTVQILVLPGHHPVDKAQAFPSGQPGYFYPHHVPGDCIFHFYGPIGQFRCTDWREKKPSWQSIPC